VLVLSMAYKRNVDDLRESPGLEIYRLLRKKGAWVEFHDPHAHSFVSVLGNTVRSTPLDDGVLGSFDAAVLVTDHDSLDYARIAREAKLVLDCRNAFGARGIAAPHVVKL
jgi:UDP-N-acetyl-D-glucosamine dehydrogenase